MSETGLETPARPWVSDGILSALHLEVGTGEGYLLPVGNSIPVSAYKESES